MTGGSEGAAEVHVVAAVAVGGVLGALARFAAGTGWPTAPGHFPWTTLAVNAVGSALLGVLAMLVPAGWQQESRRRLVRPFLGTGVLGGFTTFSGYAVDGSRLLTTGHAALGLAYLAVTPAVALAAVAFGAALTRRTRSVRPA